MPKMNPEPCHATEAPVRAYCTELANLHQTPWHVVTVPEGSMAWSLGYRYASVSNADHQSYLDGGAGHVATCLPTPKEA